MLCLEVVPEEGLQGEQWDFLLGMQFSQAVAIIQSQVGIIKSAHVVYCDTSPLAHDLILDLPLEGFRLIFHSRSQRLKLIEIYNLKLIKLKYCGSLFNSPPGTGAPVAPTVEQIDKCFGATRPGSFDKEKNLFALNFRGLTFYFPVDLQFQPHYSHGLGSLRFPMEASPVLSKILIYSGCNVSADVPVPPLPKSSYKGHIYIEECTVLRNGNATKSTGLRLRLYSQSSSLMDQSRVSFEKEVRFGESCSSITTKLGTPSRIFYKSEDKMKIHSKDAQRRLYNNKSDYFLNYFTLGIDILIDSSHHKAIKFILHSNFPGHYDFNSYLRCPFKLRIGGISRQISPTISQELREVIPTNISNTNNSITKSSSSTPSNNVSTAKSPKTKKKSLRSKKNSNSHANNVNNQGGGGSGGESGPSSDGGKENNSGGSTESSSSSSLENVKLSLPPPSTMVGSFGQLSLSNSMEPERKTMQNIMVHFDTRWEDVHSYVYGGASQERPVVLTRSSSNNPFGSSLCYGVQDLIFEVLPNDHIASITIYQDPSYCPKEEKPIGEKGGF